MSGHDERPWLALYRKQPADCAVEFDDALDMFRAGVANDPDGVALQYFVPRLPSRAGRAATPSPAA